ncbi:hypothetical protein GCM10022252_74970 [Streptosporangium oxazolinicum]|uniref:Uncharacterized protein n=1 Tax=Streptosporangium oxazolinicum TaxID=909287 RepID=A0ABP8BK98_9ACTN
MSALPAHVHSADLSGPNDRNVPVSLFVVWADRPYRLCPVCGEGVQVETGCPAVMDPSTGEAESLDQKHGCGEWLITRWIGVDSLEGIPEAAEQLAAEHADDVAKGRAEAEAELGDELREAMARLAEPLDEGETIADREAEITTGRDDMPGIYKEDGQWVAWAYDVRDEEVMITVRQEDL